MNLHSKTRFSQLLEIIHITHTFINHVISQLLDIVSFSKEIKKQWILAYNITRKPHIEREMGKIKGEWDNSYHSDLAKENEKTSNNIWAKWNLQIYRYHNTSQISQITSSKTSYNPNKSPISLIKSTHLLP